MSGPTAILDYASPRPRGKLRLPSTSKIVLTRDRREVTVTETLTGQAAAIGALAVGVFTLIQIPAFVAYYVLDALEHQNKVDPTSFICPVFIPAALWIAEIVVMLMVINNTWRRTILQARDGMMSLAFIGSIKTKRYEWPLNEIAELYVDRQMELGFINPKIELVFRSAGGPFVRLFTDHDETELEAIRAALQEAIADAT